MKGGESGRESRLEARDHSLSKKEVSSPGKERGRGGRRRWENTTRLSLVYKMIKNGVRVGHAKILNLSWAVIGCGGGL